MAALQNIDSDICGYLDIRERDEPHLLDIAVDTCLKHDPPLAIVLTAAQYAAIVPSDRAESINVPGIGDRLAVTVVDTELTTSREPLAEGQEPPDPTPRGCTHLRLIIAD